MATLTYWSARLNYKSVVADETTDLDANPQIKGINAAVTVTPFLYKPAGGQPTGRIDAIKASTLVPPSTIVLAPVLARLDDGHLALRADPDRPILPFANLAAFPGTGSANSLYRATDTDLLYEWNGSAYVTADDFATVRLVAQTSVLELEAGVSLGYRFEFTNVTFNGGRQELPPFAVAAATTDTLVDVGITTHLDL